MLVGDVYSYGGLWNICCLLWHDFHINRTRTIVVIMTYPFVGGDAFEADRRGIRYFRFFRTGGVACVLCSRVFTLSHAINDKSDEDIQDLITCFERIMGPSLFCRPKFVFDQRFNLCVHVFKSRLSQGRMSHIDRMTMFEVISPRGAARARIFGVARARVDRPRILDRRFNREGAMRDRRIFRYFRDGVLLRLTIFMRVNVYMLL